MAHAIQPYSKSREPQGLPGGPIPAPWPRAPLSSPQGPVDLAALFDLLPIAVVVVEVDLRLRRANAPALALLERREAVVAAAGRLAAARPEDDPRLLDLVREARAARGAPLRATISSAEGGHRVVLTARFLEVTQDGVTLVCLCLAEEAAPRPASTRGLSRRRREVLERLLGGARPEAIARALGLSEHTVRAYVKDLHRHFGAHSRGELLARFIPPPPTV